LDLSDDGVGGKREFPEELPADDPGAKDVCSNLPFFLQDDNLEALVGQEFCSIEAAGAGADHGYVINAHRLLSLLIPSENFFYYIPIPGKFKAR
jgi:hypothetical protein